MARSLALALYLLAASRRGSDPEPTRPDRPEGIVVWMNLGEGSGVKRLSQLARRLSELRADLSFVITADGVAPPATIGFPVGTLSDRQPAEKVNPVRAFLDHWRPNLCVLTGSTLPPALVAEASKTNAPLVLADIRITDAAFARWRWRRGMIGSLLSRFARILAQDAETAARLRDIGGRRLPVEVAGRIEETTEPLPGNEAERAALAELLATRPVWLAVACPESEEEAVIAAHARAMRLAHRMLLILVPDDPVRADRLAERMMKEGWVVARRSRDEEPDPDVQAFLADGEGELGLWYRLAPVTFMGGTLTPGGTGRNPFEPAALGSAILHGPFPGPYPDAYALLADARAARLVAGAEGLGDAVTDVIAPDRAASLAHNAWAASSGGAEVTDRVAEIVLATLDGGRGKVAG